MCERVSKFSLNYMSNQTKMCQANHFPEKAKEAQNEALYSLFVTVKSSGIYYTPESSSLCQRGNR